MARSSKASGTQRPRVIGVFTADLSDAYQVALFRGIQSEARDRGIGVVSFVGSRVRSPRPAESTANFAYGLASPESIDGLIVVSSVIGTFLSPDELRKIFAERSDLPRISVGASVPGVPSVVVDGAAGVREIVDHLVRVHDRHKIAVVGGPEGHQEATARLAACRDAMAEAGLEIDPARFMTGLFVPESGARAVESLVAGGIAFDALVCMNDGMAIGAMETLRRRGIRVPEDVAVVGFDDIEPARLASPPLTTVGQPLGRLGAVAVTLMDRMLRGEPIEDVALSAAVVVRESCGCSPPTGMRTGEEPVAERLQEEMSALIERIIEVGRTGDRDAFIESLRSILNSQVASGVDVTIWNRLIPTLRSELASPEMVHDARELVIEIERRQHARRRTEMEERFASLQFVSASLMGAFELPELLQRLSEGLAVLGIDGCHMALFEGADEGIDWSRLVLTQESPGAAVAIDPPVRYRTTELLPRASGSEWRSRQWVLEPLVFQYEPLGFMLLAGDAEGPAVFDSFRDSVATALKGALLLEQVRGHEHRLEAQVARRTAELSRANRELVREIERRIRLEREVIEISNRTMERIGQDLHDDLCQYLAGIAMHASAALSEVAAERPATADALRRIEGLLEDSISRARQIARGLFPTGLEADGLVAAVRTLAQNATRNSGVSMSFSASPDFAVTDSDLALQVYRIIQEALNNAVKHSGSPEVEVRLFTDPRTRPHDRTLVIEIVDHGSGLHSAQTDEGMGMRIMRYRAEKIDAALEFTDAGPGTRVVCRIRANGRGEA